MKDKKTPVTFIVYGKRLSNNRTYPLCTHSVIKTPTLTLLAAPEIVITTASGTDSDDKVDIIINHISMPPNVYNLTEIIKSLCHDIVCLLGRSMG